MATILVVDDSPLERTLAANILDQAEEFEIAFAEDGEEAFDYVLSNEVDVIVTDLQMPKMDGLELLKCIRNHNPEIPIIVMTSQGSEEAAVKALQNGAAGYVIKRHLGAELLPLVQKTHWIRHKSRKRAQLMDTMTHMNFTLELPNDSTVVGQAMEYMQEAIASVPTWDATEDTRLAIALDEAFKNSMIHGNLEVGSDIRESGDDSYERLTELRRATPKFRDRKLYVDFGVSREAICIVI